MNPANLVAAAQSEALQREIEQQAEEESRALLATAEREARAVISQAHMNARRRMQEAVAELRRERARRLARAKAQAETEARQRAQQYAAEAVTRSWPLLVDALFARWRDPAARLAWITAAAHQARNRIRDDTWIVEHPAQWNANERQLLRNGLGVADDAVKFIAVGDITAGIRIRAAQATLDATVEGLLADHVTIAALLLAEITPQRRNEGVVQDDAG